MASKSTAVLQEGAEPENLWTSVEDPPEQEDGVVVVRLSLDVRASDDDFLTRFAAYKNQLAKAQGVRIDRQWSRKSLAEHYVAVQCARARAQMAALRAELGELPPADDKKAMAKYAAAAAAWEKKDAK